MGSPLALAARATPTAASSSPTVAELYEEHSDFVYRTLITRRLSPHAAEDAMQEVFLVAHRRLPEFQGTFFKAWLFRIATSVAQNARRSWWRQAKRTADVDLDVLPDPGARGPFENVAHTESVELLQMLLERLGEKERDVFILAELEQLPHEEIADSLGVHVNTVANRLRSAKGNLERLLRARQTPGWGGRHV